MGRNSKTKSSKRNPVCEKLLRVLAGYPNFLKFRPREAAAAEERIKDGKGPAREEAKVGGQGVGGEGKKSGEDVNDVFSDYISRAKRRLGSVSMKRNDSGCKRKETAKEDQRFSDYISRAKNKLRATSSSVGWSKRHQQDIPPKTTTK